MNAIGKVTRVIQQLTWPRPIPVSERLPEELQWVLLWTYGMKRYYECQHSGGGFLARDGMEFGINESSVWLPMPPKPE